jgi:hypothetical protein
VLDLYTEPSDLKRPVMSFDESPTQLIGEVWKPMAAAPGRLERFDYEYKRNGTANLFVFLDVHEPWRHVKVTDQRTHSTSLLEQFRSPVRRYWERSTSSRCEAAVCKPCSTRTRREYVGALIEGGGWDRATSLSGANP